MVVGETDCISHFFSEEGRQIDIIPAVSTAGTLFPIGKMDAHRTGALHLAVSVFVFRGANMLLQRRAKTKYHCGDQWANTCCTHPHWGETLHAAATRRVVEELGVSFVLSPRNRIIYRVAVGNGLVEHEDVRIFRGEANSELRLMANPVEVSATRWATVDQIRAEIDSGPSEFAPWLRIYLARWGELGLDEPTAHTCVSAVVPQLTMAPA